MSELVAGGGGGGGGPGLTLRAPRPVRPDELMMGAIWISPDRDLVAQGRGDAGEANAAATVAAALAAGVRCFDTAPA